MLLNNRNLSDSLKQTYFLGILEQLLLETLSAEEGIPFWEMFIKSL